jgi:hypothetical protein
VRDAADSTSLEITSHVSRGPTLLSRVRQLDSSVTNGRRRVKFLWANQPNAVVKGPDKDVMVGRWLRRPRQKLPTGLPSHSRWRAWSEMDIEDLKRAVAYGSSLKEVAEFLCRSGTALDVAAKAKELGLTWREPASRTDIDDKGPRH